MQTIHITSCFHVLKEKKKKKNLHLCKITYPHVVNTVFFPWFVVFCFICFSLVQHHTHKKNSSFLTSTTFGLFKLPNDFSLTLAKFSNSACCVCFRMKKNDEDSWVQYIKTELCFLNVSVNPHGSLFVHLWFYKNLFFYCGLAKNLN